MAKPLQPVDGPMVWIDCEMTGLDPETEKIMEIAVRICGDRFRQLLMVLWT